MDVNTLNPDQTRRLIRLYTVCLQNELLNVNEIVNNNP